MKSNILKIILSVGFILYGSSHLTAQNKYPTPPNYIPHPKGEFPIKATYAFYQPFINDQQMKWVKDAGFNFIGQRLNETDLDSLMQLLPRHDMLVSVGTREMFDFSRIPHFIEKYGSNPYVWGFTIFDEPKADKFKELAEVQKDFDRMAPEQMPFFNLLPAVSPEQLGANNYQTYVESFVSIVNPPFISYDIYPIKLNGQNEIFIDENFYPTLETIARTAKDSNRPFWAYILSTKHWRYPKPTKSYLRYQIFNNLAYGAQGLSYFTYLLPDFDRGIGDFSCSPIDSNGKKTDVWKMVRDVNREVHNLAKVFLNAEVIEVSHTGKTLPKGTTRLSGLPAPFTKIETENAGVVVSHLRTGDSEFLVLVNHDVLKTQRVKLHRNKPVIRIYPNGKEKKDKGPDITLEPGGYAIFRL